MQGCFTWLLLMAGAVFVMASLLRWFEQTSDAVERRAWRRVLLLVAMPFAAWYYPSKVAAGRPAPVPRHEPVRGMGTAPKRAGGTPTASPAAPAPPAKTVMSDTPPPGTPAEFLVKPIVAPGPKSGRPQVDPEQIAKLRQKMREQGMLRDEEGEGGN